ncbi:oligosaccharide flippase family protein [Spirosoma sp. SC4-14]|uniref:lipopolysaccharide biosynthesis protein n=1 Tax=Spirosoma sp. SC4-14 TaxID=3128900 RepID=UPI0030D4962F
MESYIKNPKGLIVNFLNQGHPRSIAAKKNIIASFLIKGVSIIITFLLVPLTINYIEPSNYGIWLTLSSIISWFAFFDIGFGHGLRNKFAEAKSSGNIEQIRKYISTTYISLITVFSVVWLLFFITNQFIDWGAILNVQKKNPDELSKLSILIFTFFCLQIVLKTINIILIADQKSAKAGLSDMIGQLIALISIFVLTQVSKGSLIHVSIVLGLAPVVVLFFATIYYFKEKYKPLRPSIKYFSLHDAKDIMGLGVKFFFIQIGVIIIFQTTNIVIAQFLGPTEVTIYNIAYKYFFTLNMISIIILTPFWSAFTEAYTKQDFYWMKKTVKKLNKTWLYSIPIIIIMVLISNTLYKYWIGDKVHIPFSVSLAMGIYVLAFTRFNLFIYLINGIGKIKLQLIVYMMLCAIYIPMVILLCKWKGLEGVIWGNILISLIHACISQIQIEKLINNKANSIWNK